MIARSSSQPALALEQVSVSFGGLRAIDDVSFAVNDGEVVGLIGPNGAGKTTAFNLITGFNRPSAGRIRFRGSELVGRKPALFRLLLETAISGRDEAVPAEERDYVQQIHSEPTAEGKLAVYARALPSIHARLAPLLVVLQAAAPTDPALADLWTQISERRAGNMTRFAGELEETGRLGVSVAEAADVIWATNSPEMYLLLVGQRGWSHERYEHWLAATWQRLLLRG